jgi:hypothetical protein
MTVQEQMDLQIVWDVFTGFIKNHLTESTAILRTADVMNRSHDQIKEAIYGKA